MKKYLITSIVFVITALIFGYTGIKDWRVLSKEPVDLADVEWDTLDETSHVTVTIDVVWDCLYSETTTEKTYFITTNEYESARGYVIPHLFVNKDGYYDIDHFIGVRLTGENDYRIMEQIMEETNNWYFDTTGTVDYGMTTITIEGMLKKMSSEELALMREYLIYYCEYSSSEADELICPYMIVKANPSAPKVSMIVASIFLAIAVINYIVGRKKEEKEEMAMYARPTISTPKEEPVYYGPEGSGEAMQRGYQYGGTNSYGNTDIYNGNTYTPKEQAVDESTGLSMDFLRRSEEERLQKEREAQFNREPEPSQNPLYGNQTPQTPVTPSQSFSNYDQTIQSNNFGGGIYGTRDDRQ